MDDKNPLKMKVTELKVELGRRGLSQTGLKFDLAQRLQTAMDVDEFGALPSLASSSPPSLSSSSPLLQVPGRDSTDQQDSPSQSAMQTSSYEPNKGHAATDKHPSDLEMVVETESIEGRTAKPGEKPKSTDTPSTTVLDSPQSNTNAPALKEALSSGKGDDDENGVNGDGSDPNVEMDILGDERTLGKCNESDANEKKNDTKNVAVVEEESMQRPIDDTSFGENNKESKECPTFGEKAIVMPSSSHYCDEKNDGTAEGGGVVTVGEENTPLLPLVSPDSTSAPASPPRHNIGCLSPRERESQTGEGAKVVDKNMNDQREGLASDEPKGCGADQSNDANRDGSSEVPPDSLLLCTQAERMKDREARFRQEKKREKNDIIEESSVEDSKKSPGVNCAQANSDWHDHGGRAGGSGYSSGSGGVGGEGGLSGNDASSEAPGAGNAEDTRKTKLMKRKERFMAPPPPAGNSPPSVSKKIPCAKVDTLSADCPASKVLTGTVLEQTGGTARSWSQVARDAAAKMVKRAERFGVKQKGSCVPSAEISPADVRDPRGSFFTKAEGTSEGNTEKQPEASDAAPVGYSFDPLPPRQKRARKTTATWRENDGATAKRRWVGAGGGQADIAGGAESPGGRGALENTDGEAPPSGAAATAGINGNQKKQTTLEEATKPSERHVSFAPAVKDGVDESRVREAAGNPSSGRKATPMGSIFASLGGVKTAPKTLSATAKSAGEGASKRSRLGCPDAGKEVPKQQSHGREKRKSMASPTSRISSHGRGGGKGNESSPPQGPRRVCRDSARETKAAAEQAAKMAERRQRFAEDPRAPSFR